jgi:hypothetical protein
MPQFQLGAAALVLTWLAIAALAAAAQERDGGNSQACRFETMPQVLSQSGAPNVKGSQILQVWDIPDSPVLWTAKPPSTGSYESFATKLRGAGVETDPVKLLERSNPIANGRIVTENAPAWIQPINCLEMLLLSAQNDRIEILNDPTEFASFVLRSADKARLRIVYFSKNENGIGNVGTIMVPVRQDHARGYRLLAMLHNHNFELRGPRYNGLNGILAPSAPDAHLQRGLADDFQLEEAWITNGLHTSRIPARAFDRFQISQ